MYQRVGGAVAWIGAFIWLCIPRFGPEFFRSFLYDRLLSIFHPYLVDFGPPLLLATVGAYLFWLSGGKSWRLQGKAVLVDRLAPMHEVIAHVATRIGDKNTSEFWPEARRSIRQAALDGDVQVYGNKSEDTGNSNATSWSLVSTPISKNYWELADITVIATEPIYADELMHQTMQHRLSDGRFTREEIAFYAKLKAKWGDVKKNGLRWVSIGTNKRGPPKRPFSFKRDGAYALLRRFCS